MALSDKTITASFSGPKINGHGIIPPQPRPFHFSGRHRPPIPGREPLHFQLFPFPRHSRRGVDTAQSQQQELQTGIVLD